MEQNGPYGTSAEPPVYDGFSQFGKVPVVNYRTNGYAIVSLVCAFVFSPLAVIFGHMALKQIATTGEQGRGLAVAGLVLGYLVIGLAVAYFVFVGVMIATLGDTGGTVTIEELGG